MPPPRPYWKGYLKLSLVSCPISVYSATSAAERGKKVATEGAPKRPPVAKPKGPGRKTG